MGRAETFLVLPLFNLSHSPNLDWIGESVAETVREAASSGRLVVLDREDREEAYRRLGLRPYAQLTLASVVKLGQVLAADKVLYGSLDLTPPPPELTVDGRPKDVKGRTRGTLKLSARILDLKDMKEGGAFSEVGALEDLAALQRHLAWQAIQIVSPGTAPGEDDFLKQHPRIRVDALESYIRGLLAQSGPDKQKLFAQAVRLDPGFSQASFELGRLNWNQQQYREAAEWLAKVSPEDSHAHEAKFLLGLSHYELGDYAGAERALSDVALAVPLSEVFNDLGAAQSRRNRPEALDNFRKALQGDETDAAYQFNTGYALWKAGDFSGAAKLFQQALSRDPGDREAALLLERSRAGVGPKPGERELEGIERIKTNFEESAYKQLKEVFQPKAKP